MCLFFGLILAASRCTSGRDCHELVSPCPRRVEVTGWCAENDGHCTADGMRADCVGGCDASDCSGYCNLDRDMVLSIPVSEVFTGEAEVTDLLVEYSNPQGWPDVAVAKNSVVVLNGIVGTHTTLTPGLPHGGPHASVVRWSPFPQPPSILDVVFHDGDVRGASALGCAL